MMFEKHLVQKQRRKFNTYMHNFYYKQEPFIQRMLYQFDKFFQLQKLKQMTTEVDDQMHEFCK